MNQRLREASQSGNIDALYTMIQEDVYLLDIFDKEPFSETPLHIAAALGHTEFALEIINLKSSFCKKLSPTGLTPMHLALQNQQSESVVALLKSNPDLVRVRGREGVTALHHVAKEGNVDLLAQFLLACPQSIQDVTVRCQTALHIAVIAKRLAALQILTRCLRRNWQKSARLFEIQVMNMADNQGNTVLHLAAYNNQHDAIIELLDCWGVNRNIQNQAGLTAFDILQGQNNREIRDIVQKAGGLGTRSLPKTSTLNEVMRSKITHSEYLVTYIARKRTSMTPDSRNALLVAVVLIITATYQTALSPPGGVWQGGGVEDDLHRPGTVVMNIGYYYAIWFSNTIAFWFSLVLTPVLLPGGAYTSLLGLIFFFLCVSYIVSMIVISPVRTKYDIAIRFFVLGVLGIGLLCSLFVRWKNNIFKKLQERRL